MTRPASIRVVFHAVLLAAVPPGKAVATGKRDGPSGPGSRRWHLI
jgi:hypothetical protein